MKLLRRFFCWMLGCRSICLYSWYVPDSHGGRARSHLTGWKCERCLNTFNEQWDWP